MAHCSCKPVTVLANHAPARIATPAATLAPERARRVLLGSVGRWMAESTRIPVLVIGEARADAER